MIRELSTGDRLRASAAFVVALALMGVGATARAQWGTDPEEGDTTTPPPGTTTTTSTPPATTATASSSSSSAGSSAETTAPAAPPSSVRLALQARLSVVNVQLYGLELRGSGGDTLVSVSAPAPFITAGVRLPRIFVGVGFGFFGSSFSQCDRTSDMGCDESETTTSTSGFSLAPLFSLDFLQDPTGQGALNVVAWIPLISGGGVSVEEVAGGTTTTMETKNDFWWGVNIGIGARYNIVPGVALGTEWGWGFLSSSSDGSMGGPADDSSVFVHGIWGNLLFEASIGL